MSPPALLLAWPTPPRFQAAATRTTPPPIRPPSIPLERRHRPQEDRRAPDRLLLGRRRRADRPLVGQPELTIPLIRAQARGGCGRNLRAQIQFAILEVQFGVQ